jgi:hypothetical protein
LGPLSSRPHEARAFTARVSRSEVQSYWLPSEEQMLRCYFFLNSTPLGCGEGKRNFATRNCNKEFNPLFQILHPEAIQGTKMAYGSPMVTVAVTAGRVGN